MKRSIVGAVLGAATVAAVLAIGPGGMATATPDQESEVCYEQVPYTVYQFSKTVQTETFKTQYEIDKYVRDRTRDVKYTSSIWQNFSPNNENGPFEGPPSWPTDPDGTWNHQNKPIPPGQAGPDGVYQNGNGNGSWFYRQASVADGYTDWTAWSAPYRWNVNGTPPHLKWVDVVPAANWQKHGNVDTETYQRQWTEYPTGATREVPTGTEKSTVYYNNNNVGPTDLAVDGFRNPGWTTDQTPEGWGDPIRTDEFMKDGKRIPCSGPQPPQPPVLTPGISPDPPEVIKPDCDAPGEVVLPDPMEGYTWEPQPDGTTWKAVITKPGLVFDQSAVTTFEYFGDLSQLEDCDDVESKPPVVAPPTVAPPAVVPPAVAPPAQIPAAGAPTQLPSTGSSSWALALIALVTLLGGTGLVRLSRRPTD